MSEFRTIIIKNSSTPGATPTTTDLEVGELALNITDRFIFTKNESNEIIKLGTSQKVFSGTVNIDTDSTYSLDLESVFTTQELDSLDVNGCNIVVRTLDVDNTSPTHNVNIDASAIVTKGVNQNRYIVIHNHYEQALDFYIRIDIPIK